MTVYYEWDVETVSRDADDALEGDEILEHNHVGSFKEAMAYLKEYVDDYRVYHRIVLVRDSDTERSWAQFDLTKFELDEFFDDSYREICRVPSKFHKEVLKQKELSK